MATKFLQRHDFTIPKVAIAASYFDTQLALLKRGTTE